jgi:hypothetical protein
MQFLASSKKLEELEGPLSLIEELLRHWRLQIMLQKVAAMHFWA